VEHLGRGTARGVDAMLVVVDPSQRSVETALRVEQLAGEIGPKNILFVGNKVSSPEDEQFILGAFPEGKVLGSIPYSDELRRSEREGRAALEGLGPEMVGRFEALLEALEKT
jgi:CO dehydrogenase maturation factor